MRRCGLVVLLVSYGVAVTVSPPSHPLLNGALLFALLAATLWSPSLGRRPALLSVGLIGAAALIAIPVAAKLDGSEPWLDYRNWDFGGAAAGAVESFDWNQGYGPLDWQRDGCTLVEVRSAEPHYWATEVLDHFDGTGWVGSSGQPGVDLPIDAGGDLQKTLNTKWVVPLRFEVRALSSQLLVRAGTVLSVSGADPLPESAQGVSVSRPLREGDSYSIRAYDPQPTAAAMRSSEAAYPARLSRYTTVDVPRVGKLAPPNTNVQSPPLAITLRSVTVPLRGGPAAAAAPGLLDSPYAPVYRLARHLAAGRPTAFAVAAAMQRYPRSRYRYDESPPTHRFALPAFLFRDRRGYCQQFSGAMALMLRMVGIPSRVVGGFAPGERIRDGFVVSDFDAHSWVEVYFNRIGWVTFDPTPAAAPAVARSIGPTASARRPFGRFQTGSPRSRLPARRRAAGGGGPTSFAVGWVALVAALAIAALVAIAAVIHRGARHRELGSTQLAELQAIELRAATARLGPAQRPGVTLRGLEASLGRAKRHGAATYAAHLRRSRYAAGAIEPPSSRQRRNARRALASGLGWQGRLRIWLLMPPGGPTARWRS